VESRRSSDVPRGGGTVPAKAIPSCRHCGASLIDDRMRASGFCCAGCSYVFRLVHEHGLSGYYRIKDDITTPADAAVFHPRDYGWLDAAQLAAESDINKTPEQMVDVQGISCAGCVWLIERVFQQQPGARDIVVNAQYGTMRLRWVRDQFSAVEFARKLQAFGYLVGPAGETPPEPESRGLVKRIGLCAAFAMNVMLFSLPTYFGMESTYEWAGLFALLNVAFGTLSLLVGGTYFLSRAVRAVRERALHIDLPIGVGIVGAYLGSLYGWLAGKEHFVYFDFVSTFILLMLVGRWAQVAAVERNRRRLLSQQPKPQRVRLANRTEMPPEQLIADVSIFVAVGQTLAVESRLETAEATFSLASINGEAEPRVFRAGQRVPAGAVNVGRTELRLTTLQAWTDSLLAQLLQPGERAGAQHVLLERIVRGYLVGILVVAVLAGAGWWLGTGDALRTWAVVTAVLVVSCPCAIALAFPLADEMATIALRRRGVFVREGDLWTKLARVRKLVFDKTGTLTLETPVLKNPEALPALDSGARAALLALVRDNPHPVSQCLLENLLALGPIAPLGGEVREAIGDGVEMDGWSLGRAGWRDNPTAMARQPDASSAGDTGTVFARHGQKLASFVFVDTARPDARAEIAALGQAGFASYILSGDRPEKVAVLAAELGLDADRAIGGLAPREKAAWFDCNNSDDAMMLGDGANDSLAFDRALCRGTPVVHRGILERKADFYYLGRGIGGVRALFEVNAIRRRTQMMVLVFSVVYNLLAVGLAVAGKMNPLVAAALMPINSLLTLALVTGGMRQAFRGLVRS
jgi:P-type Cu2+ transporter